MRAQQWNLFDICAKTDPRQVRSIAEGLTTGSQFELRVENFPQADEILLGLACREVRAEGERLTMLLAERYSMRKYAPVFAPNPAAF